MAERKARNRCSIMACRKFNGIEIENVSFFKVPKDRLEVYQFCTPTKLSYSSLLCSRHFDDSSILKGKLILGEFHKYSRWKLKKDALPKHLKDGKGLTCIQQYI